MSVPRQAIFISYRRSDSVYAVDQLDERLTQALGAGAVFRDASGIEPGSVFPERIRGALGEARVALVVIGPWWLRVSHDPVDVRSPRRLDDPADWVRREIETLLARNESTSTAPVYRPRRTREGLAAYRAMQLSGAARRSWKTQKTAESFLSLRKPSRIRPPFAEHWTHADNRR